MIRVDRSNVAKPKTLSTLNGPGRTETASVIAFYSDPKNLGKKFKTYEAYSLKEVKDSLLLLFNRKCAYCEIDYGGCPLDVEHYRPKGAIVELDPVTFKPFKRSKRVKALKPGYYWLAAKWENLLPSCIDCNRRRDHEYQIHGTQTTGKGNYFPLAQGSIRARKHGDTTTLRLEQPVLLNPCEDDPAVHLHFGTEGDIVGDTERGKATIEVLGLLREDLVRKRKTVLTLLLGSITNVKEARRRLAVDPNDDLAKGLMLRELKAIRESYLGAHAPYLAMCRQVVDAELGHR